MVTAELGAAYVADTTEAQKWIADLRRVASHPFENATSESVDAIGQIKAFVEWLEDDRPNLRQASRIRINLPS